MVQFCYGSFEEVSFVVRGGNAFAYCALADERAIINLRGDTVKTVIVYYSQHHGNTKKLVDAIAAQSDVTLIDAAENQCVDLTAFDCIGFASGAYFSSFAKQLLVFAETNLPEKKNVFFLNTCGVQSGLYFDAIGKITEAKQCHRLGAYQCLGFDTFGPFKLVGGIAKGHPNGKEIAAAVEFYQTILKNSEIP